MSLIPGGTTLIHINILTQTQTSACIFLWWQIYLLKRFVIKKRVVEFRDQLTDPLHSVLQWFESSHLTMNVKTVSICFSKHKNERFMVKIKNVLIKYLGIILDSHLKCDKQVNNL